MPSEVVTQIAEIKNLRAHPDADRLELCDVGGWQLVCGKGLYKEGERIVYVTPDSLISEALADILEIRQHLSSVKNPDGTFVTNEAGQTMMRVRQAKLRGEPSFGTTVPRDVVLDLTMKDIDLLPLGENLAEELGVMKYEPAMRASAGDAEVDHPLFVKYTSIENLRNYPNVLEEGEQVIITEKIHGTNCRVGIIEGELMAGSHGLRRKNPEESNGDKLWRNNTYWYPMSITGVRKLLYTLGKEHKQVIIFGEVFGNVQKKYSYGVPNGIGFRAFDIMIDGKYLDYEQFENICNEYEVERVPSLVQMAYSYEDVSEYMESFKTSTMSEQHPIEGGVVKPLVERNDRKVGRVVLKYITNAYLFDKGGSDYKDV